MSRRLIRVGRYALILAMFVMVLIGVSGYLVFSRASEDSLVKADAIVVLGGEHDGREEYGLSLARQGLARTVVMSDPYRPEDQVMQHHCATRIINVEVICRAPKPSSTRGEALLARELASARKWTKIIVVTWRFHLTRTRLIFDQCFSDVPGSVVYRAVPRSYDYSPLRWEFTYAYQYGAFVKAVLQGSCY